jgi:hypothetical protein
MTVARSRRADHHATKVNDSSYWHHTFTSSLVLSLSNNEKDHQVCLVRPNRIVVSAESFVFASFCFSLLHSSIGLQNMSFDIGYLLYELASL